MRIATEYEDIYIPRNKEGQTNTREEKISDRVKNKINEQNKEQWKTKAKHGYLFKKIDETQTNVATKCNTWLKEGKFSSHVEGNLCASQEQEIQAKALQRQREKDPNVKKNMDRKCRICEVEEKNIFRVIASCSHLPSNLYLNTRYNPVGQALYNDIVVNAAKTKRTNSYKKPDPTTRTGPLEIW